MEFKPKWNGIINSKKKQGHMRSSISLSFLYLNRFARFFLYVLSPQGERSFKLAVCDQFINNAFQILDAKTANRTQSGDRERFPDFNQPDHVFFTVPRSYPVLR